MAAEAAAAHLGAGSKLDWRCDCCRHVNAASAESCALCTRSRQVAVYFTEAVAAAPPTWSTVFINEAAAADGAVPAMLRLAKRARVATAAGSSSSSSSAAAAPDGAALNSSSEDALDADAVARLLLPEGEYKALLQTLSEASRPVDPPFPSQPTFTVNDIDWSGINDAAVLRDQLKRLTTRLLAVTGGEQRGLHEAETQTMKDPGSVGMEAVLDRYYAESGRPPPSAAAAPSGSAVAYQGSLGGPPPSGSSSGGLQGAQGGLYAGQQQPQLQRQFQQQQQSQLQQQPVQQHSHALYPGGGQQLQQPQHQMPPAGGTQQYNLPQQHPQQQHPQQQYPQQLQQQPVYPQQLQQQPVYPPAAAATASSFLASHPHPVAAAAPTYSETLSLSSSAPAAQAPDDPMGLGPPPPQIPQQHQQAPEYAVALYGSSSSPPAEAASSVYAAEPVAMYATAPNDSETRQGLLPELPYTYSAPGYQAAGGGESGALQASPPSLLTGPSEGEAAGTVVGVLPSWQPAQLSSMEDL